MTGSRLPNRPYFDRTRRKRGHLVQKLPHSAETPPPAGCMRAETPPVSRPHVHRHLVQKPRTTAETPCRPATYAQRPSSLNRRPIAHVQGDRPDACGHPPPSPPDAPLAPPRMHPSSRPSARRAFAVCRNPSRHQKVSSLFPQLNP